MSTPVVAAVVGPDVELCSLPTSDLLGLFAKIQAARAELAVLLVEVGEAIVSRGTDIKVVARALKSAQVPDARRQAAVIDALPVLPTAAAAFRAGAMGFDHLVPLARLSKRLPEQFAAAEADLTAQAKLRTAKGVKALVAEFIQRHEPQPKLEDDPQLGVRFHQLDDGRIECHAVLDPLTGAMFEKALDDVADEQWREQHPERNRQQVERPEHPVRLLNALRALCDRTNRSARRRSRRSRYLLQVLIDYQSLLHGLHERSISITAAGQPLPVETVRKLACEADLLPIVLSGDSIPIDMGRTKRWFTDAQHDAALAMFQTCALCDVPAEHCALHHMHDWDHGGLTDMNNACALCASCHDVAHREQLTLTRSNGIVTATRPDGTIHTTRAYNTSPRELKLTA